MVLGMMVPGLIRCANWLAATLPVVVLVAIVGGVQPPLVLLTAAGLGSSVFAAAALALAVSVYAPNRSRAVSVGIGLLIAWLDIPLLVEFLLPRVWPGSPRWLVHRLHCLVDSSPAGVGASAFLPTLVPRPFGLIEAILPMIAVQVTGASVLVLWAAWQLRPPSRALHDGEWPTLTRWIWRATRPRPIPRQSCGGDPVLWNEIYSQRARSLTGRLVSGLARLVGIGVLALGTSWFAFPAFSELAERGFGSVLDSLSHRVVALLLRGRPVPGSLGRASATRRGEHQIRRERPDGAGCLLDGHAHSRRRRLLPDAIGMPKVRLQGRAPRSFAG